MIRRAGRLQDVGGEMSTQELEERIQRAEILQELHAARALEGDARVKKLKSLCSSCALDMMSDGEGPVQEIPEDCMTRFRVLSKMLEEHGIKKPRGCSM